MVRVIVCIVCLCVMTFVGEKRMRALRHTKHILVLHILIIGYSPFYDRVGLPLHNIHIPSPFTSINGHLPLCCCCLFAVSVHVHSVWVSRLEIVEFPDDVCRLFHKSDGIIVVG